MYTIVGSSLWVVVCSWHEGAERAPVHIRLSKSHTDDLTTVPYIGDDSMA